MKYSLTLGSLLALASFVKGQQPEYDQCGGIGWTGATTCVSPYVCTFENDYYYQCLPATSSTSTTSTTSTTTTTTTTTSKTTTTTTTTTTSKTTTTTTTSTSTTSSVAPAGTGFVSTASSPSPHFVLDGEPFYWSGTNGYFIPQINAADAITAFETMQTLGLKVVRIWMFNEVTETQDYGAYYHLWDGATATFNLGPYGFDQMDYTLALATEYGIKVILTLTNNWYSYGGADVYVQQLGYEYHDQFYTEADIIAAYKTYIDFVVDRYVDNTTVFGWEIMNEPRCAGTLLPTSSSCDSAVLTAWVDEISTYVHSIDSNHIVGVGDEGFFCWTNTTDFIYDCGTGGDSNAYSELSGIDFLTFHMYPESWGEETPSIADWGSLWIEQHAYVQQASGKPSILEEFGTLEADDADKYPIYSQWYQTAEEYQLAGVAYWQLGNDDTEIIDYTESDADTVFCPDYTETCAVISAFSEYMDSLN